MVKTERLKYIVHEVNLHNKVLISDLSEQIEVSTDTIRRDVQELSDLGKLIKIHGGALSTSFHSGTNTTKNIYAYTQKKIISRKAISLIQNGMFILTGGGTTILEIAKGLPDDLSATFITGSLPVLLEYTKHPLLEVIAIGDRVSKSSRITVGFEAISKIKEIRADICFLGINAINLENGISDNDWEVVRVKKAMIESSKKLVCLTISEKINTLQPLQVCDLSKIDILITELDPSHEILQDYWKAGIRVL